MKQCMLSTFDNPFNPFDQFNEWLSFDKQNGYDSSEKVARLAKLSDEMSTVEEDKAVEQAIDRLIELDPFNIYIKITKDLHIPTDEEVDNLP